MLKTVNETLTFTPLSNEEKLNRGILGRLAGPIASCVSATRNGRKYTDALWEKAFDQPLVKEMFKNGGLPGELNHPADRSETDATKIAIMMPEPPVKDADGQLIACVDILDTPCGKIAYQLAKYGFQFGISSRGEGEVSDSWNGEEVVDEDTYVLNAFDLVLLPAVESARLRMVESLENKKPLKVALREELENSSDEDKEVMKQTLNELKIDYSSEQDENNPEKVNNIDAVTTEETPIVEAENSGSENDALIQELQEALRVQQEFEKQVKTLQEQLSVCYTKEARYSEVLSCKKAELVNAQAQTKALEEQLKVSSDIINKNKTLVESLTSKIAVLKQRLAENKDKRNSLNESISSKNTTINSLQEQLSSLTTKYKHQNESYNKVVEENKHLVESLEDAKKDSNIQKSQYSAKISKSQELVEKYKLIAKTATDKYITSQAHRLGIRTEDIKSKLGDNYSFGDIDRICENLQRYRLTVNSLPFNVEPKKTVKMSIKESKEVIHGTEDNKFDDEIDTTLSSLLN